MRAIFFSGLALAAALAAGCVANTTEDTASSDQAEISTGLILRGDDRRLKLGNGAGDREVLQWGRGLWEGFASFDVVLEGSEAGGVDKARLVDATGARYELSKTQTRFERLPVPIRLLASTDETEDSVAHFTNVAFEVTRTNPISPETFAGKYSGTTPAIQRRIGFDLKGVSMSLAVEAHLYSNFTNGNACSRVVFSDGAGQTFTLQPSSTSRQLTLTAPVDVRAESTCVSSRLATQENSDADFDLAISTIRLSDARPAQPPEPPPQPHSVVIYGESDSCDDSKIVASLSPTTDCATLRDCDCARSWSVKVDGRCIDIDDTTSREACVAHHP